LQDALNQAIYREKDAQNKLEASLSSSENREKDWIKELLSTQSRLAALKETMSKLQKKEDTSHTLKQLLQERKALDNGNISLAAELMEQAQYLKSAQVDQVVAEAVQNHVLPQAGEAAELQTFTVRPKKKRNPPNKGHSTTGLGNPRGFSYIEALEAYDTMTSEERHNAHVNSAGMDDKYRDNCLQESCRGEEDDDGCVVM
jgi:hypothetical protein